MNLYFSIIVSFCLYAQVHSVCRPATVDDVYRILREHNRNGENINTRCRNDASFFSRYFRDLVVGPICIGDLSRLQPIEEPDYNSSYRIRTHVTTHRYSLGIKLKKLFVSFTTKDASISGAPDVRMKINGGKDHLIRFVCETKIYDNGDCDAKVKSVLIERMEYIPPETFTEGLVTGSMTGLFTWFTSVYPTWTARHLWENTLVEMFQDTSLQSPFAVVCEKFLITNETKIVTSLKQ